MKDKDNIIRFMAAIVADFDYAISNRLTDNVWYIASKRVFIAIRQSAAAYWKLSKQEAQEYKLPTKGTYIVRQLPPDGEEIRLEESEVYGLIGRFNILRKKSIIGSRWSLEKLGPTLDIYETSLIGQSLSIRTGLHINYAFLKMLTIPKNYASFNRVLIPAPVSCGEDPFVFISESKQLRFYVMGMHYEAIKEV